MDRQETFKIIAVLKANYMETMNKCTKQDIEAMASIWERSFQDIPYEVVNAGVDVFINTNESHFCPKVSEIKNIIYKMMYKPMTESEAYAMVQKAIGNSNYHAKEEFEKLPPVLQRAVGSPDNLRAMAIDSKYTRGVESSNFERIYRSALEQEQRDALTPERTKEIFKIAMQGVERNLLTTNE